MAFTWTPSGADGTLKLMNSGPPPPLWDEFIRSPTAWLLTTVTIIVLFDSVIKGWRERRAAQLRISVELTSVSTGFFRGAFDKLLFRDAVGDTIFEVVPDSAELPVGGDLKSSTVRHKFVPLPRDYNESLLARAEPPLPALQLPKFACEIGIQNADGSVTIVGMGTRVGDYLVTARHIFHSPGKLAYKATSCILRRDEYNVPVPLGAPVLLSKGCKGATWQDVVAYKIKPGLFAAIHVRSLKITEFHNTGEGMVEVFGRPNTCLMRSRGHIHRNKELEAQRGILSHTANTTEGYSGSPVVTMKSGQPKLVGMHIAGGTAHDQVNFAVSHCGLALMFQAIGFIPKSQPGSIFDRLLGKPPAKQEVKEVKEESREKDEVQSEIDWAFWDDDHEQMFDERRVRKRADPEEGSRNKSDPWQELHDQEQERIHGSGAQVSRAFAKRWADEYDETKNAHLETLCANCGHDTDAFSMDKLAEFLYFQLRDVKAKGEGLSPQGWIPRDLLSKCELTRFSNKKLRDTLRHLDRAGHLTIISYKDQSYIIPIDFEGDYKPPPGPSEKPSADSEPESTLKLEIKVAPKPEPTPKPETKAFGFKNHSPGAEYQPLAAAPRDTIPTEDLPFGGEGLPPMVPEDAPAKGGKFWSDTRTQCFERAASLQAACPDVEQDPGWYYAQTGRCCIGHQHLSRDQCNGFYLWMKTGRWSHLDAFHGVGAQNLLRMQGAQEFVRYMSHGGANVWDKDNLTRGGNIIHNANGEKHAFRVGTCGRGYQKGKSSKKVSAEFASHLKGQIWHGRDLSEDVKDYVLPPSGPDAIRESFKSQCERQKPGNWDRLREVPDFSKMVREFCDEYPATEPTTKTPIGELVDSYLNSMDGTKSAGWSARYKPGTKGVWARTQEDRNQLLYLVQMRIALRVAEGDNIHHLPAEEMIRLGLNDPKEMFTKLEAHDGKKAKSKRWRLIWVVSMVDSVCQDVLHRAQNKADILAYTTGALDVQAVGLGHHDEGIKRIGEVFDRMTGGDEWIHCSDASGWDMSVCRDAIYFDAERRISRQSEYDDIFTRLIWAEAACNSAHVVVIGTALWSFEHFGITASGIPSTSAQNSPIRGFTLRAAGAKKLVTLGDDEAHVGKIDWELLASTGVMTKEGASRCPPHGPVEFTSHIYQRDPEGGPWGATFNNLAKMLAHLDLRRLEGEAPSSDMVGGMRHALRHSPEADEIFCSVCDKMGWWPATPLDVRWD